MAQHVGMNGHRSLGLLAVFAQGEVDGERCRGFRCSLRKNARPKTLPGAFRCARCTSQALMARISSPRSGWVVERPPINRTRQRSRVSFRLPRTFSNNRSIFLAER